MLHMYQVLTTRGQKVVQAEKHKMSHLPGFEVFMIEVESDVDELPQVLHSLYVNIVHNLCVFLSSDLRGKPSDLRGEKVPEVDRVDRVLGVSLAPAGVVLRLKFHVVALGRQILGGF